MKYQQVSVDFVNMVVTAFSYLALAGAVWILLRLIQACFWLPSHLRKQNVVQRLLQEKVDNYEKYLQNCEEGDKLLGEEEKTENKKDLSESMENVCSNTEKWKSQRECLELLKKELDNVRNGVNIEHWDHLLDENKSEIISNTEYDESKIENRFGIECSDKDVQINEKDSEDADEKECDNEDGVEESPVIEEKKQK